MKLLYNIVGGIAAVTMLFSCTKSILDIKPTDQVNDILLWQNQDMVLTYTANFYAQLQSSFKSPIEGVPSAWLLADITDDGDAARPTLYKGPYTFFTGVYDASNSPLNSAWESRYKYIRRMNTFLQHIDNVPGDKALNQRMKGEVKFLRAYLYFDLMSWFGGVPLITKPQNNLDNTAFLPRNSMKECTDFLIKELSYAADSCHLPLTYPSSDFGRITKGAALALKCRVQLYASRWADAAATADTIMQLGVYALQNNYAAIFANNNKTNSEIILSVQANDNRDEKGHSFDTYNQPPGYGGRGYSCPTQNLVNAYEMKATGLPITNPASGYNPQHPYVGRDPRFYATVLYDSAVFKGRAMEMYKDGYDISTSGGLRASYLSKTGYYLRKFMDESLDLQADPHVSSQNWIIFRYAGILLDYAEAQNEAVGPDQSVYNAVNAIRERKSVNLPALPAGLSQSDMREAIRQERRVELAFEGHRYWDVKRWKLATTLFSTATNPIEKMTITLDDNTGIKTYKVETLKENRYFLDKHYLFPIPLDEMNKPGNKMTQNSGWEN